MSDEYENQTHHDDEWLSTEIEADLATGPAAGALMQSVADTLKEAPDDRRYDLDITVTEREP